MNQMPLDRRTWEVAMRDVQIHVITQTARSRMKLAEKRVFDGIYAFCRDQIAQGPPLPSTTNQALARKYSISLRTVTNWRREGCPFDQGQVKVLDWLAGRRYAPAGARQKFFPQLAKRKLPPFFSREFWEARDAARQFKRDCIEHGEEPPEWTKGFRATRRTKGMPTGKRPKRQRVGKKPGKPRKKVNYGLKFLVEASKVPVVI